MKCPHMSNSNIVHLTSAHRRDDVRIFNRECRSIALSGYNVILLVADGLGDEVVEEVSIKDLGKFRGRFKRFFLARWVFFFFSFRLRKWASVYHYHEPELHLIALFLKITRVRVIFDSHEDTPRAILNRSWITPILRRPISHVYEKFENFVCRRVFGVIAATPEIERRFSKINKNSVGVFNYPPRTEIINAVDKSYGNNAVCYIGMISIERGIFEMVRAMENSPYQLILAGKFDTPELEQKVKYMPGWKNVEYVGWVDRNMTKAIMNRSDAGLAFFHPDENHVNAGPNKIFEYMAAGIPVLASNFASWTPLIEGRSTGLQCDPLNVTGISALITQVVSDPKLAALMGKSGLDAISQSFHWEYEVKKMLELYSRSA